MAALPTALGPERSQREIELAARLKPPRVASVHDSGEVGGSWLPGGPHAY